LRGWSRRSVAAQRLGASAGTALLQSVVDAAVAVFKAGASSSPVALARFLTRSELSAALRGTAVDDADIRRRRAEHATALATPAPDVIGPPPVPPPPVEAIPRRYRATVGAILWSAAVEESAPVRSEASGGKALRGVPASPGRTRGTVRIVRGEHEFGRIEAGDILVCPTTVAAWSPVFAMIGGLVTEHGGLLSHPAILAREYGLPAVLGVPDAMARLADGSEVEIDGQAGTVVRLPERDDVGGATTRPTIALR
jgi:pyruvate,water dikinase